MRIAVLATAALVLLAGSAVAIAGSDEAELYPRAWDSTAVERGGTPHPLFEETRVTVNFVRAGENVGWKADCNSFGAGGQIRKHRLVLGQIIGTQIGCPGPPARRDAWLARFFGSDPRWRILDSGLLRLTVGDRIINLARRQSGR